MKPAKPETIVRRLLDVSCCTGHEGANNHPMWKFAMRRAKKCATCRKLLEMEVERMMEGTR